MSRLQELDAAPLYVPLEDDLMLVRLHNNDFVGRQVVDVCADAKPDPSFDLETSFRGAIDIYSELTPHAAAERMESRYEGESPLLIGYVMLKGERPIGLASISPEGTAWRDPATGHTVELEENAGVNFSLWMLGEFQGAGVGSQIVRWQMGLIDEVTAEDRLWEGVRPFTSVRMQNEASNRMVAGLDRFEIVGEQVKYEGASDDMRRQIWLER